MHQLNQENVIFGIIFFYDIEVTLYELSWKLHSKDHAP